MMTIYLVILLVCLSQGIESQVINNLDDKFGVNGQNVSFDWIYSGLTGNPSEISWWEGAVATGARIMTYDFTFGISIEDPYKGLVDFNDSPTGSAILILINVVTNTTKRTFSVEVQQGLAKYNSDADLLGVIPESLNLYSSTSVTINGQELTCDGTEKSVSLTLTETHDIIVRNPPPVDYDGVLFEATLSGDVKLCDVDGKCEFPGVTLSGNVQTELLVQPRNVDAYPSNSDKGSGCKFKFTEPTTPIDPGMSPSPHDTSDPTQSSTEEPKKDLSDGAIAGIVVGCVAAVVIIIIIVVCCRKKTKEKPVPRCITQQPWNGTSTMPQHGRARGIPPEQVIPYAFPDPCCRLPQPNATTIPVVYNAKDKSQNISVNPQRMGYDNPTYNGRMEPPPDYDERSRYVTGPQHVSSVHVR